MRGRATRPGPARYYLLEGLNALGTNVFFMGVYFHARAAFGFSDTANLLLAATQGACYVAAARAGGRLADRAGPDRSLSIGLAGMCLALLAAWRLQQPWALFASMGAYSASTALTWPALEAAIARAPGSVPLARRAGLYNVVWSFVGAAGFFLFGALFELDPRTVFWAPLAAHALQLAGLAVAARLRDDNARQAVGERGDGDAKRGDPAARTSSAEGWREAGVPDGAQLRASTDGGAQRQDPVARTSNAEGWREAGVPDGAQLRASTDGGAQRQDPVARTSRAEGWREAGAPEARNRYLRSAWVANGLGYFLFGAFTALAPALGERLGLDPRHAIWLVSTYLFARSAAFVLLWLRGGWEYHTGWLVAALVLPPAALAALFAAPTAGAAIAALGLLGALSGLSYSVSLHASLDREGREGEGGGLHEWVIGLGVLIGPLAGAAGVHQFGGLAGAGSLVTSLGALASLAGLASLRRRAGG